MDKKKWHATDEGRKANIEMILQSINSDNNKNYLAKLLSDRPNFQKNFDEWFTTHKLDENLKDNIYLMSGRFYEHVRQFNNREINQPKLKEFYDYSNEFYLLKSFLENKHLRSIKLVPTKRSDSIDISSSILLSLIENSLKVMSLKITPPDKIESGNIKYTKIFTTPNYETDVKNCVGAFAVLYDYLCFYSTMEKKQICFAIVDFSKYLGFDILQNTKEDAESYLKGQFKTRNRTDSSFR